MGFVRSLIILTLGVYAGIYLAQNYPVPTLKKPNEFLRKAKSWYDGTDDIDRRNKNIKKIFDNTEDDDDREEEEDEEFVYQTESRNGY